VTAALVNLRFLIFSAGTSRAFTKLPLHQRVFSAYFNGDLPFAFFSRRYGISEGTPEHWGFYYGVAGLSFVVWHIATVVGIVVGNLAPASWGLDLAAALALVAVLVPMLKKFPAVVGVLVTGALALATIHVPLRLGLLASIVCGLGAALWAETLADRRKVAV
jgi:predicted branched-subunit amino acid permease